MKRLRDFGVDAYGVDISEWAVSYANAPYIRQLDVSIESVGRTFDLVYSYDVVEHVLPERLESMAKAMWGATKKDLLVVPAVYENGETSDPDEPTHLIFQSRQWWLEFFVNTIGCRFDKEATERFAALEHSRIFNYSNRILIFSRAERTDFVEQLKSFQIERCPE